MDPHFVATEFPGAFSLLVMGLFFVAISIYARVCSALEQRKKNEVCLSVSTSEMVSSYEEQHKRAA